MVQSVTYQSFKANWDEKNNSINPAHSARHFIFNKFRNLFFYLPNTLIAACINPRKESKNYNFDFQHLSGGGKCFSKEIITPDNVKLSASIFTINGYNSQTPTIILFNPLGCNKEIFSDLSDSIISTKQFNVIRFDYRGLGNTWSAKDLVLDGESVYQFAIKELGTLQDKIHFFGYSLGGAIAAQVKALHPESKGKYIGDRVFSSIFSIITENLCVSRFGYIIKLITSLIPRLFIAYPVYFLGWEIDTKKSLERMKGRKMTIYHPNDCLVPFEANAARYNMDNRKSYSSNETGGKTHFAPITELTIDNKKAELTLIDFLRK
ncbi:MAG: alpha/beta hydrolase [Parachlamydiales bacterium]|nr:alpha/beta hydrolase [Parachlamydiales bacterium]